MSPTTPTVFISYSHKDEAWKDRLVPQLQALEMAGLDMKVWHDRKIDGGDKWYPEIQAAIDSAAVAVLLISPDFLASAFCVKEEVPALIRRQEQGGMLLIPVLVRACPWKAHRWLRERQMLPCDGKCIAIDFAGDLADGVLAQVAEQVMAHLEPPPAPPLVLRDSGALKTDYVTDLRFSFPDAEAPDIAPEPTVDLTHLPDTDSSLFGRDAELELLDQAWAPADSAVPPVRVLAFTAHGGVGKSTLVNHWLGEMRRDGFRGARQVFGWSFYSQGVRAQTTASSDLFISAALRFFGDADPSAGSAWDKGRRLAHLVGSRRALLVLDGLEPLQSGQAFDHGKLRDPAMESLLRGLARQSAGLCLITTREALPDLAGRPGFHAHDLEQISPEAGRALLRTLRVVGTDAQLEDLARRFGPHALAISLLGVYLREQPGRGVEPAVELEKLPGDTPLERVLAGFEQWLGPSAELDTLRLLGLFDRPADAGCLAALRKAPVIPGLTDQLAMRKSEQWHAVALRLEYLRLVQIQQDDSGGFSLDAHPLLREHFGKNRQPLLSEEWRTGHRRLYEHLRETTKEGERPSLEDLQPLYQAVAHGCLAGLQQEAYDEIYRTRILRGNQFYSSRKLGAMGSDLAAVACFFEVPWSRVSSVLTEVDHAWLLNQASIRLSALGLLNEALEPMRAAMNTVTKRANWKQAATTASNLSALELTLGQINGNENNQPSSTKDAALALMYAERSGDTFQRMSKRAAYADALNQAGLQTKAGQLFREAEVLQRERQPEYPLLYSMAGFRYGDLLMAQIESDSWHACLERGNRSVDTAVLHNMKLRAEKTLQWSMTVPNVSLLDIALHHLTLGRVTLYATILKGATVSLDPLSWTWDGRVAIRINQAMDGLRRSGYMDEIPRGLLTRAWLRTLQGHPTGPDSAQTDLDEAWEIAERGPMPLHMADIHLHRARLFLHHTPYPWQSPKHDLAEARRLIEKHGYWRRREELEDAEAAAGIAPLTTSHTHTPPDSH